MIRIYQQGQQITILLKANIINLSQQPFDLVGLQLAINEQLRKVYHCSVGRYSLHIVPEITIIKSIRECSTYKVLFQITDTIPGNNPAEADFKGLRIKLNKTAIQDIISGRNVRTIPHEVGHLLGLDHPHDRAMFQSINPKAHLLEQTLNENERQHNLMSQTWYIQKTGIHLKEALQLSEKQIEVILEYYNKNQLNKNHHLKQFLFWKKIV